MYWNRLKKRLKRKECYSRKNMKPYKTAYQMMKWKMMKYKMMINLKASQWHYRNFYPYQEKTESPWMEIYDDYAPLKPGQQAILNYDCKNNEAADEFFVPLSGKCNSNDDCEVCLEKMSNGSEVSKMTRCVHKFHTKCIQDACKISQRCPVCRVCGPKMEGNCPPGQMMWEVIDELKGRLAGYEDCKVIVITYTMFGGIQDDRHQNPGVFYQGMQWKAFLPDNSQGNRVLELFKKAWKMKRTFTIGRSLALNADNRITWNDIHHKTNIEPNSEYGYPDPTYLTRVVEDMKAMGIQ